ncbi:MAG: M15 family metallopeptidase [Cyanobacteria bacterium J06597_16]
MSKPYSPVSKTSGKTPRREIPPARRQPTEISLAEIERIGTHVQPKPRKTGRNLSILVLIGTAGIGIWQWEAIWPYAKPAIASAQVMASQGKNAIATATKNLQQAVKRGPSSSPASTATAPGTAASPRQITITEPRANSPLSKNPVATEAAAGETSQPNELLNHRQYDEAQQEQLVTLNPNSIIKLQPEAQVAVNKMIAKAKSEGVQLGIVSGFRTIEDQDYLYFDVKAERGESAKTRAEVSAPPGYSEHHTGYAVDFIDESKPDTHVERSFETTPAYKWLQKNAAFYSFELSFPDEPTSKVGYEPWHWRYIGNRESLELFYK